MFCLVCQANFLAKQHILNANVPLLTVARRVQARHILC